ncbi:MAG: NHLP family bacteriocin export ABC transporter peptidase/permease/ATPase subunit [Acidobacteria bacterium]|nr:MAG: NHLP family bacteriocin export ABC transporter peptidase/permease/ATPase subunit [Acidobacteriota bacterium]
MTTAADTTGRFATFFTTPLHLSRFVARRGRATKRVKTPTVLQMEAVECGAAALAMVLAYFGRFVPLEELRVECGVSRDGSKASNVLKAARAYGLDAKGFRKEPAQLRTLPVPMILHWNFNHFVVFEGFRRGGAYINDPAAGAMRISEDELDQAFTGVALVFQRSAAFVRGGERASLLRALRRRLVGSGAALAFVVTAGFALLVPGLVAPAFNKVFVDEVLIKGLATWIKPLLWLMGAGALVTAALTWLQQTYLLRLESTMSLTMSSRFLWHVLRLPVDFFAQRFAGDISYRVGINDRVARLLSGDLATTALNVSVIALYAAILFQYDVLLSLVGTTTATLNIVALRYASHVRTSVNDRMLQDRGKLMGTAIGGLQTIDTLKATGSESDFFARWAGYQAKVVNSYQRLQLVTLVLAAVPPFLLALNNALVLGLGGLRVMDGQLTMGMLIAFQALMTAFLSPVNKLVELGGTLQEVKGDMTRLDDVMRAPLDPPLGRPKTTLAPESASKLAGDLELRHVTFGYSRLEPPLIEDFSLTLKPGNRVALVGGSGSGKSTVTRLVAGLYEPWTGEVLFDGKSRHDVPREVMAASLSVVDQDICLFEDTVAANVTLWDDTISEVDLVRAATDACIHDDVTLRPGGYGGPVTEGGRNYSGGQRQRLEIARALASNPRVLLLDEATSALDPTTEKQIDDNLRRRGCTCLIVAHRLSTIRDCDEIVVLARGKIVQRGTHDTLIGTNGPYRDLITAQ